MLTVVILSTNCVEYLSCIHKVHMSSLKTIVVPTDFSENAFHALIYAVDLAKTSNAIIHLLNVYHIPNPLKTLPLEIIITPDELKASSDSMLKQTSQHLKDLRPESGPVVCHSENGFALQEINHYANYIHADLVVIGMTGGGKMKEKILGSTATGLLHHCTIPVLVVPENIPFRVPKKILFASDGSVVHSQSHLKVLMEMAYKYESTIDILSVLSHENMHRRETIMDLLDRSFLTTRHHYYFPEKTDINKTINEYIARLETDLLVMIPRKHNFLEQLFDRSHTRALAFHTRIPLLSIPDF